MSKFLAVDTSSRYLAVAAVNGGKSAVKHIEDCAMQHSTAVMDAIEEVMGEAGLSPCDCDFFCAVTGPGSFTGIRIGVSTVKGLALGADRPAVGLTSFALAAYNVNSENFCVVIDAAHSHYYAQGFGSGAFPPAYLSKEQVCALGMPIYGFEELPFEGYTKLSTEKCLIPAATAAGSAGDPPEALYVRKSQAEEGRK